ncbi:MAG: SprT-like domain-containing protein [Verrucomicrobiota bacterium]|nr:SprT-like domain-containing protein [Verrucomicrobiota bacterium]
MLWFKQLDFVFTSPSPTLGRDATLEMEARRLLESVGAGKLARQVCVEWNPRLRSAAGRAIFRNAIVSLNPKLREHGADEIDRTLRHELAHLIAQMRAGRRRIAPHGAEWRRACRDLGIADEQRCHTLPFPTSTHARRFLYRCRHCQKDFPRVRRIRRTVACLECCRRYNRGEFDRRFQIELVRVVGRVS